MRPRFAPLGLATLAVTAALAAPADAREVTLTTTMARNFIGGAYLVIYLVDTEGKYTTTVWVAGATQNYFSHFRQWWRGIDVAHLDRAVEVDGKTGASVRRGEVLVLTVDLADELFDAGLVLRIDSTLYEGRDYGADVAVPLSIGQAGVAVDGRGYVASLMIDI